jgi:hypothetical protein
MKTHLWQGAILILWGLSGQIGISFTDFENPLDKREMERTLPGSHPDLAEGEIPPAVLEDQPPSEMVDVSGSVKRHNRGKKIHSKKLAMIPFNPDKNPKSMQDETATTGENKKKRLPFASAPPSLSPYSLTDIHQINPDFASLYEKSPRSGG